MKQTDTNSVAMSRRDFLAKSGVVLAGLALLNSPARIFAQEGDAMVLPWLDQRIGDPPPERVANQQTWEKLNSCITRRVNIA